MNVPDIVYVALGCAAGGVCRHLVSFALNPATGFPWGTLCVNVFGSLALGLFSGWLAAGGAHAAARRAVAVVGFCGGFTTFSTFSNETFRLFENGQPGLALLYAGVSLAGGLAAVATGYWIAR